MKNYIGIDIAKSHFDLAACREKLLALGESLIVMEATGGYEKKLARALISTGLRVAVVNPARVRNYAN